MLGFRNEDGDYENVSCFQVRLEDDLDKRYVIVEADTGGNMTRHPSTFRFAERQDSLINDRSAGSQEGPTSSMDRGRSDSS
jgi:hypothetical protein